MLLKVELYIKGLHHDVGCKDIKIKEYCQKQIFRFFYLLCTNQKFAVNVVLYMYLFTLRKFSSDSNFSETIFQIIDTISQLPDRLRRERTFLMQNYNRDERCVQLITHLVSYRGRNGMYKTSSSALSTERGSLTPDGYTNHAEGYRFFTLPTV